LKENSHHLRIYPLRKACLIFEREKKEHPQLLSLFKEEREPELIYLECFTILNEHLEVISIINETTIILFGDLFHRQFFSPSFIKFIQEKNHVRDVYSKCFIFKFLRFVLIMSSEMEMLKH
jgi:hypothetical protein